MFIWVLRVGDSEISIAKCQLVSGHKQDGDRVFVRRMVTGTVFTVDSGMVFKESIDAIKFLHSLINCNAEKDFCSKENLEV